MTGRQIPPPPGPLDPRRRREGELVPMKDKEGIPVGEVLKELEKQAGEPTIEVPEAPNPMPPMSPGAKDLPDEFEWAEDPVTFTFERLVFDERPLEDVCVVHEGLKVRLRTLTGTEIAELNSRITIWELQSSNAGTLDYHSMRVMARSVLEINDKLYPFGPVEENDEKGKVAANPYAKVEKVLGSKPTEFVLLLSRVYNEFDRRVARLARRGSVKNLSGPRSDSSAPESGENDSGTAGSKPITAATPSVSSSS